MTLYNHIIIIINIKVLKTLEIRRRGGKIMTIEALKEAIAKLITKRAEAHGNAEEQSRINAKLEKLYNLKYLAIEQASR